MKIIKKLKGFTLVELIIVITILTILGTIGFISFQDYFADARDTNRITTMKNIENGLQLYKMKTRKYPMPEEGIEISNSSLGMGSGLLIGYQGKLGEEVSGDINMQKIPLDPLDEEKYIYYVSEDKKKYQLLTYLENDSGIAGNNYTINKTYADYLDRVPTSFGNELGIILDENINLIQGSGGKFDVFDTNNTSLRVYSKNLDTVTLSGGFLYLDTYAKTGSGGTPCDSPDFMVYGPNEKVHILASCNMGAHKSWNKTMGYTGDTAVASSNYITNKHYEFVGNYYQWGRNDPVGVVNGVKLFVESGTGKYNGEYKTSGINLTGSGFITGTGSLYNTWIDNESHESSKDVDWKKGPCPQGYKIPTLENYSDIMYSLVNKKEYCVGCTNEITFFQNSLKMPKSGSLEWTAGSYGWYGTRGLYWTSEPGINGGTKFFDITYSGYSYVLGAGTAVRARGFPIRCFKD